MICQNVTYAHFDTVNGETIPLSGVVRRCSCGRLIPKQDLYRGNSDHETAERPDDVQPNMMLWIVPPLIDMVLNGAEIHKYPVTK